MDDQIKFAHGGNVHQLRRQAVTADCPPLDFSANINPLGLSASVKAAILQSIPDLIHYPDPDGLELKEAIAAHYDAGMDEITLGNGAVELLYILCHTLRVQRALIPAPSFSEYERAARAVNADIRYHFLARETQFRFCPENFLPQLADADFICIGNPNNPTGILTNPCDLERCIAAAAEKKCFVVIDESFIDFLPDAKRYTCNSLIRRYKNLLILHSMTKFYAIPGLRLGFALTNPKLTQALHDGKDPWNVNALAQRAGVAALRDMQYQQDTRDFLMWEKQTFCRRLMQIPGLTVFAPSVNFILIDLAKTHWSAAGLKRALLEHYILIRDCGNYPGLGSSYIRLAVKNHLENQRCADTLTAIMAREEAQ